MSFGNRFDFGKKLIRALNKIRLEMRLGGPVIAFTKFVVWIEFAR